MATRTIRLTGNDTADALLSSSDDALIAGMLLDQQVPMEKAFSGPAVIAERMGGAFDVDAIAALDSDQFAGLCAQPPAVHRFPESMGKRLHALCVCLRDDYASSATNIWSGVSTGQELLKRLVALPGFGEQKARIFVALLAKQCGVTSDGWEEAAGDYALPGFVSVADIVDAESLAKVRAHKRQAKAAAKQRGLE